MQDQLNNVAKFLEARGLPEQALSVATDPDYRFELAVRARFMCTYCSAVILPAWQWHTARHAVTLHATLGKAHGWLHTFRAKCKVSSL